MVPVVPVRQVLIRSIYWKGTQSLTPSVRAPPPPGRGGHGNQLMYGPPPPGRGGHFMLPFLHL